MGTRADFYVGRGEDAEWLGSIALDGYPEGLPEHLLAPQHETSFRPNVAAFLASREDATLPKDGWPWPWEDSRTTDYAYALDGQEVWASCFGREWFKAAEGEPDDDAVEGLKVAIFPNMKDRQNVTFGKRSGLIVFGG